MVDHSIQPFLDCVQSINKRYEQLAKISGENFNIFKLLKIGNYEVTTHSNFIGELLKPEGSHGQKDVFLKLFLTAIFKITGQIKFHDKSLTVSLERYTGLINEEKTEGGRVDIMISDANNNRIIIENKIYAGDQENQVLRYYNFDQSAKIFYLTLFGDSPKVINKKLKLGENFFTLSYKTDILNWLIQCHEKAASQPILRETLTQYIYLLKSLTNQSKHSEMSNEITELITKNTSNFQASMLIANEFDSVKNNLLKIFWNDIKSALENTSNLNGNFSITKDMSQTCPALFIKTEVTDVFIGLEPLNGKHYKSSFNNLFIGIYDKSRAIKADYSGPFPEWRNCKLTEYNFGDINKTLRLILPNSAEINKLKEEIVSLVQDYFKKIVDPYIKSNYQSEKSQER